MADGRRPIYTRDKTYSRSVLMTELYYFFTNLDPKTNPQERADQMSRIIENYVHAVIRRTGGQWYVNPNAHLISIPNHALDPLKYDVS